MGDINRKTNSQNACTTEFLNIVGAYGCSSHITLPAEMKIE